MSRWKEQIKRLRSFAKTGIWEVHEDRPVRKRPFLVHPAKVASLVFHDFFADGCLLRASALTYTSLLSLVPLLALMFALLKGLGVQNTLEPLILEKLAVGSEEIVTAVISYINNTNVGRLGLFGLLALLGTVVTLLSNIEKSFNHVWGVKETRPLTRRFADYFSVVTIGPLLVIAAISITSTLQSGAVETKIGSLPYVWQVLAYFLGFVPYLGMWIVFTALYIFMPNSKVNYQAAVIGGIFGGTLWQLAQWGYVEFQIGMAKYNAIYGTMAALPILMVWIYVSWLIVLLGLEVTYAWQHLRLVPSEVRPDQVSFSCKERIALVILLMVSKRFYNGEPAWDLEEFSMELDLPPRLAKNILSRLVRLGFLSEVRTGDGDGCVYGLGRSPESLKVSAVRKALRSEGLSYERMLPTPEGSLVDTLIGKIEGAETAALEDASFQQLVIGIVQESEKGETPATA